jgi:phenylacetate-CoA ligase
MTRLTPAPLAGPVSDRVLREFHLEYERLLSAGCAARLHWSAARLCDQRQRGLRELLSTAQEQSPWHRRRLAGIDLARMRETDLGRLPVMSRADVVANFDEILTDRRLSLSRVADHLAGPESESRYLLERYHPVRSRGAGGVFVYDWEGWATCYAGALRYFVRDFGGRPVSMAVIGRGGAAHISRAILDTFSDPSMIRIHPLADMPAIDLVLSDLAAIEPDAVFTDPAGLDQLIDAARTGALRIRPRAIITAGQPLTAEVREAAQSLFEARVLNWWMSAEAGPMAIGCGHGPWMHLSDDLIIFEPVDEHGRAVAPGTRSAKVLLTVLYNHALPLIRYELDDEITVLEQPCPCGSRHTLIEDVQARRAARDPRAQSRTLVESIE